MSSYPDFHPSAPIQLRPIVAPHLPTLRVRRQTSPLSSGLVDSPDVLAPRLNVRSQDAAVVCQQAVHLALHVRGLRVDGTATGPALSLLPNVAHEGHGTVVVRIEVLVDFVGVIDLGDGTRNVPETGERKRRPSSA